MTTLAYSQFCYQDVLSPACVGLSRKCNAESGIGCRPLWAGPTQAPYYGVVALGAHDALLQRAPDSRRVAIDLFRGSLKVILQIFWSSHVQEESQKKFRARHLRTLHYYRVNCWSRFGATARQCFDNNSNRRNRWSLDGIRLQPP